MISALPSLQKEIQDLNIIESLQYFVKKYPNEVIFSTSFGEEDQVITDFIFANKLPIKIFTLDTGRLFKETYDVFYKTELKYQQKIQTYFPDTKQVENLMNTKGPMSFYDSVENRKECCNIRKIIPLKRALSGNKIWITGLRAEQSDNRQEMKQLEWATNFEIIKYNPLINWTLEETKTYIAQKGIPCNVLHNKGFISIGCAPCTRAIKAGESIRAGRWWWEESKKECGLHG